MTHNRFEVHTWTLCQGWLNCWSVTDKNGSEQPDSYSTIKAAQDEIDELLEDIKEQVKSGERSPDETYDPEDYKIYDKISNEYIA